MPARNGLERWRGEVTATLAHLREAVGSLDTKLEALGDRFEAALAKHVEEDRQDFARVETKADEVARGQASIRGKVAIASALIGAVVAAGIQIGMERIVGP